MGAVRHGDFIAKVRFAPAHACADAVEHRVVDLQSEADAYRRALVVELQQRPFEFDLQVQLCTNLQHMPVEDVTVEWPEALSPFVTVAKVRVPAQDISGADNLEKMDALSFTPWRVTAEHAPLGEIQRVRKEVYRRSSIVRHRLNRQERREPRACARCSARQGLQTSRDLFDLDLQKRRVCGSRLSHTWNTGPRRLNSRSNRNITRSNQPEEQARFSDG